MGRRIQTDLDDIFPARLAECRGMRGLSQQQLANATGLPASSISHFESGRRSPSLANLRLLTAALDADASYLLGVRPQPAPGRMADRLHMALGRLTVTEREAVHDLVHGLLRGRDG